jgi:hypothetical protein
MDTVWLRELIFKLGCTFKVCFTLEKLVFRVWPRSLVLLSQKLLKSSSLLAALSFNAMNYSHRLSFQNLLVHVVEDWPVVFHVNRSRLWLFSNLPTILIQLIIQLLSYIELDTAILGILSYQWLLAWSLVMTCASSRLRCCCLNHRLVSAIKSLSKQNRIEISILKLSKFWVKPTLGERPTVLLQEIRYLSCSFIDNRTV